MQVAIFVFFFSPCSAAFLGRGSLGFSLSFLRFRFSSLAERLVFIFQGLLKKHRLEPRACWRYLIGRTRKEEEEEDTYLFSPPLFQPVGGFLQDLRRNLLLAAYSRVLCHSSRGGCSSNPLHLFFNHHHHHHHHHYQRSYFFSHATSAECL